MCDGWRVPVRPKFYFSTPLPASGEEGGGLPSGLGEVGGPVASKYVIGWREWVSFPKLGIPGVKTKVDTGARTSALHTHDYEVTEKDGERWVRFHLHPLRNREDIELECEAPVTGFREGEAARLLRESTWEHMGLGAQGAHGAIHMGLAAHGAIHMDGPY